MTRGPVDPLTPFVFLRNNGPYRTSDRRFSADVLVAPASCRTGLATSRRAGSLVHLVKALAVAHFGASVRFGARWRCGDGSTDVIVVADATAHGGICKRCSERARGVAVYRCFDASNQLLYIGSTVNWRARLTLHKKASAWWPQVAETTFEYFPDEPSARAAEAVAIRAEHPRHNIYVPQVAVVDVADVKVGGAA